MVLNTKKNKAKNKLQIPLLICSYLLLLFYALSDNETDSRTSSIEKKQNKGL